VSAAEIAAPTPEALARAGRLIRAGALVAFPTDTVYGLGADATADAAVRRVYAAKGRAPDKPLIVLLRTAREAERHGRFGDTARRLAGAFWPGPLTLVLPRAADSPLSPLINAAGASVALRVPGNATTRALLEAAQRPLTAPSANRAGGPNPVSAADVARELGPGVALILDAGSSAGAAASTILDLSGAQPLLLRAGAVGRAEIEALIGPLAEPPARA
jgi:L-threonylcarbamoyladenylate synthase